ncbi:MAG: hypothetical protein AAGG68_05900 [Bacteroidota bacterium]
MTRLPTITLLLFFLFSCELGNDHEMISSIETQVLDEFDGNEEIPIINHDDNTQKSSLCPPRTAWVCGKIDYSGTRCWTLEECDQGSNHCLDAYLNSYFGAKNCREKIVNQYGTPVTVQNNTYGDEIVIDNIVREEINDSDCPHYTGYECFSENNCIYPYQAQHIVDCIYEAARDLRPDSSTGYYILHDVHVYYTQKTELCGPGAWDPCYCDNKRMVVKLTYREELVGLCGVAHG